MAEQGGVKAGSLLHFLGKMILFLCVLQGPFTVNTSQLHPSPMSSLPASELLLLAGKLEKSSFIHVNRSCDRYEMPPRWTQTEPEGTGWDSTWRVIHGQQVGLKAVPKPHLTTPAGPGANPTLGTAEGERRFSRNGKALGMRTFYFALKRGLQPERKTAALFCPDGRALSRGCLNSDITARSGSPLTPAGAGARGQRARTLAQWVTLQHRRSTSQALASAWECVWALSPLTPRPSLRSAGGTAWPTERCQVAMPPLRGWRSSPRPPPSSNRGQEEPCDHE